MQPNTHTCGDLRSWKCNHESWVRESLAAEMQEVGFAELEMASRAIAAHPMPPVTDFTATPPVERLKRNRLTGEIARLLNIGYMQVGEVEAFIRDAGGLDPEFPEALKAGFVGRYNVLRSEGLDGDALFLALQEFASPPRWDSGVGCVGRDQINTSANTPASTMAPANRAPGSVLLGRPSRTAIGSPSTRPLTACAARWPGDRRGLFAQCIYRRQQLIGCPPIVEGDSDVRVAQNAVAVDHECRRNVHPLVVHHQLLRHPVGGAHPRQRIRQDRVRRVELRGPCGGPERLLRHHDQQLHMALLELSSSARQLPELAAADWSPVRELE